MIRIRINQLFIDSAMNELHNANYLKKIITPNLKTTSLQWFIPRLYEQYPDLPLEFKLQSLTPPRFQIKDSDVTLFFNVRVYLNVLTLMNTTFRNRWQSDTFLK